MTMGNSLLWNSVKIESDKKVDPENKGNEWRPVELFGPITTDIRFELKEIGNYWTIVKSNNF